MIDKKGLIRKEIRLRGDQFYYLTMLSAEATLKAGEEVNVSEILRGILDTYMQSESKSKSKKKK